RDADDLARRIEHLVVAGHHRAAPSAETGNKLVRQSTFTWLLMSAVTVLAVVMQVKVPDLPSVWTVPASMAFSAFVWRMYLLSRSSLSSPGVQASA
ncbi:MAG: hypothetical protein ABI652_07110, partial [Acidobacteriota bacterium]